MAKQPESRLQLQIRHALEAEFPGSWWMKVHGSPYQPAGVPDLIGCVHGRFVALEVKRPGHHPTPVQRRTIKRIQYTDGISGVVHSIDEAINLVRDAL